MTFIIIIIITVWMFIAWLIRAVPRKSSLRSVKFILISLNIQTYILYTNTLYLSLMCLWEMIFMCGGVQYGLHPSHFLHKPRFVMFVTLQLRGQCGLGLGAREPLLIVNCPLGDLYTHQRKLLIIAGMINIMSQH